MKTSPTATLGGLTHYARVLAATLDPRCRRPGRRWRCPGRLGPSITNEFGTLKTSKVTGHTNKGATFAGKYNVTKFVTRNGHLKAVGRLPAP